MNNRIILSDRGIAYPLCDQRCVVEYNGHEFPIYLTDRVGGEALAVVDVTAIVKEKIPVLLQSPVDRIFYMLYHIAKVPSPTESLFRERLISLAEMYATTGEVQGNLYLILTDGSNICISFSDNGYITRTFEKS